MSTALFLFDNSKGVSLKNQRERQAGSWIWHAVALDCLLRRKRRVVLGPRSNSPGTRPHLLVVQIGDLGQVVLGLVVANTSVSTSIG